MKKNVIAFLIIAAVMLAFVSCGSGAQSGNSSEASSQADGSGDIPDGIAYFSDSDYKDVSGAYDAVITLSGETGTISDISRGSSGAEVTVTSKGVYRVSGTSQNVTITINDSTESGNVYLVLDNVAMTNSSAPCINVEAADKVIVFSTGVNTLSCASSDKEAVIFAKDDITFGGTGSLNIGSSQHGIIGKDDVKVTGSDIIIDCEWIGVKSNESFRMGGGSLNVTSGRDGIQVGNSEGSGFFYLETGVLNISSGYDGISLMSESENTEGYVLFAGGSAYITAGGGHTSSKNSSVSQKGIKSAGTVSVKGTALTVSSADDAIHSSNDVYISKGSVTLATSDDGIHADKTLEISGGTLSVTKSYEGLEGYLINIGGGKISIVSSDDGINAAGGSDTASTDTRPSFWGSNSFGGALNISGGDLYVNANGDGLDSNGSIYITGGSIIVEGPTGSGNGAIDAGDGADCVASITGGSILAIGSTDMAVNFDAGTQCSALVSISGSQGTVITVDDGSGFSWTAIKSFECAVYSSPYMVQGNTYTLTAGSSSVSLDFSSGLYYSNVTDGREGNRGNR